MDPQTLSRYLDYPTQTPPPGVLPNFVNPDSNAYQVYITAGVCIPLMIIFALTRLISKINLGKRLVIIDESKLPRRFRKLVTHIALHSHLPVRFGKHFKHYIGVI
jgi:hypothetical protein